MGSGQLGRGEERLSCTLCRGRQLNRSLGRAGTPLSAHGAGARLGLEKHACRRSTKTLPAAGTNLLLVLLSMDVNKKLLVNVEASFSSIYSPSRETIVTHPPSSPPRQVIVWGCCPGQDGAVARPQRRSVTFNVH